MTGKCQHWFKPSLKISSCYTPCCSHTRAGSESSRRRPQIEFIMTAKCEIGLPKQRQAALRIYANQPLMVFGSVSQFPCQLTLGYLFSIPSPWLYKLRKPSFPALLEISSCSMLQSHSAHTDFLGTWCCRQQEEGRRARARRNGKCCSSASKTNDQELRFKQKAFHGFRPEKINILRRQHESHLKEIK